MKEIRYLYHFIDKANKSKISLYNFVKYKEKNNSFFSKYLKKFLLKGNKNEIIKSYILKSYTTLVREINSSNQNFPNKSILFYRTTTFFRLVYYIYFSIRTSAKSSVFFDSNQLIKKNLFVCFNFPTYAFNESKNQKSSFFNSILPELKEHRLISINGYSKEDGAAMFNPTVFFLKTTFIFNNF